MIYGRPKPYKIALSTAGLLGTFRAAPKPCTFQEDTPCFRDLMYIPLIEGYWKIWVYSALAPPPAEAHDSPLNPEAVHQ